jgi:hypothetical protein
MHSAEWRFFMKELMVDFLQATVFFRIPSYRLCLMRNMKADSMHIHYKSITNNLHINKLEFTYELLVVFVEK